MITYYFDGGLANVCFQIFAMFLYCKKYHIDYSNIKIDKNCCRHLCYDSKIIDQYPILENLEFFQNISNNLVDNLDVKFEGSVDIKSLNKEYDDVVISGYDFPTCKTTLDNIELFTKIFYNSELFDNVYKKYKDVIANSYGIHIRRTDFLELHKNTTLNSNDVCEIIERNNDKNILVFSDDMDWCKNNITGNNVYFIQNEKNYEDLILMSMCKDCCNNTQSSFSWFGFKYLSLLDYDT